MDIDRWIEERESSKIESTLSAAWMRRRGSQDTTQLSRVRYRLPVSWSRKRENCADRAAHRRIAPLIESVPPTNCFFLTETSCWNNHWRPGLTSRVNTGGSNEKCYWMRRRFPYSGNSYLRGRQGLHKRRCCGRHCGPFRRASRRSWSGGGLHNRSSRGQQTHKTAGLSVRPTRRTSLA